jgi:DNA-directed RNA polymerase subunit beta'
VDHVERVYEFSTRDTLLIEDGQFIKAGSPITNGHFDLRKLMDLTDVFTVQRYLMTEVQGIYASQGQTVNDKHIEIIVKQMFSRVRIIDPG